MSGRNGVSKAVQFRHILLAHEADEPDFELFRYAAMIASIFDVEQTLVAVAPGQEAPGSLVAVARSAFDAHSSGKLAFRLLFQPDPATLFEVAAEEGAELLVAPTAFPKWNGSVEQLAFESRYPVWFLPQRFGVHLRRAVVRIDLTHAGAALLHTAAAACRAAGVDELVVAHIFSQRTLDQDEVSLGQMLVDRSLDLYRFMGRVDLRGVTCTPVVEESLRPVDAAIRLAKHYNPDILFDSLSWPGIQTGWTRREASRYLHNVGVPVMNIPAPGKRPGRLRILGSKLFSESEQAFG